MAAPQHHDPAEDPDDPPPVPQRPRPRVGLGGILLGQLVLGAARPRT